MALDQIRTISVERLLGKITTVDPRRALAIPQVIFADQEGTSGQGVKHYGVKALTSFPSVLVPRPSRLVNFAPSPSGL